MMSARDAFVGRWNVSAKELALITCLITLCPNASSAFQGTSASDSLVGRYVALRLQYDPTLAYGIGTPPADDMHLPDRSPAALQDLRGEEDKLLAAMKATAIPADGHADAGYLALREELESRKALRVCHTEYWDVNHMLGWQVELPAMAATLPAGTPAERLRLLKLWGTLPKYLSSDIDNLRAGLAQGYSVPQAVARRVLRQIDSLLAIPTGKSPFFAPALGANDDTFAATLRADLEGQIMPAIRRYADFLRKEYLPRTRESLGLAALKDGAACYTAFLRRYTTTDDSPALIFSEGEKIVNQSTRDIERIGRHLYGATALTTIIERSRSDPRNRFISREQLVEFSSATVLRSEDLSRSLFFHLPSQTVFVKPLPEYQQGTGVSSSYEANADSGRSATFWIATDQWRSETKGSAEVTAVHETIPGHHLQIATARELHPATILTKLVSNAAYVEGWANYAERLAEESGIDNDDNERIQRRVLAGRSLVIDPGIHAFGWTRERAQAFAMETGMSREEADEVIDRISVEPGQLTSYEVGGLEILSLRERARRQFGRKFDIRVFHRCVLADGPLPLLVLRTNVESCLARSQK